MRLYRPHIPLEVRCRVILRQLGELWIDELIDAISGSLRSLLEEKLQQLATLLNCGVKDLRLDHDPALATRQLTGEAKATKYFPDANDPKFLIYREKHAHHIKTNVRGDGAQYPDRVLIKRERRRREGKRSKPKRKWASRPFPKRKIQMRPFARTS